MACKIINTTNTANDDIYTTGRCSCCGVEMYIDYHYINFCPSCGATVAEVVEEEPKKPDLLPCPFCGSKPELIFRESSRKNEWIIRHICDPLALPRFESEKKAIEVWNTMVGK